MKGADRYRDIVIRKAEKLREEGYSVEARTILEELAVHTSEDPQLFYNLGMVCMELHDNPAACSHFKELVRLQPDFLEGRMLLGMTYAELGQQEEAVDCLRNVLAECPDIPEVRHRLGLSLAELHRYEDAYREYQELLRINPKHIGVLCSLGALLTTTGQVGEARKVLMQALEYEPTAISVINNLARVCKIGHAAESLQWFQKGLDIDPQDPSLTSNYLYTLNYVPGLSPDFIAEKYRDYAPRAFHPPEGFIPPAKVTRQNENKLRIGYISADFYGHSVAFFFEPVMQNHDRKRFEIFCYSNRKVQDETTKRLQAYSDGWRCIVGLSDPQVSDMVVEDRIDILVDLSGHTAGNRLGVFTRRPAPVQVSWIGHPNTTGLPQMDYYLSDAWCDPPGMTEKYYCEHLYRLPRTFCCYLPPEKFSHVAPVPSLSSGHITFGCFNSMAKINGELIAWWSRILDSVPGSRLFVKGPALDDQGVRAELYDCFRECGILQERLLVQGITETREEHLARYAEVDIALDTFPYHGTTTTCEAFWMGVPVITLAGNTHVSRVGVSLLHAVGLDDLIASAPEEYVAKAVALANDCGRLIELRENLRMMMARSPLMDAAGVTREVEDSFLDVMQLRRSNG